MASRLRKKNSQKSELSFASSVVISSPCFGNVATMQGQIMLKNIAQLSAWAVTVTVLLYLALQPDRAVLLSNPLACLGVGLIGTGFYVDARRRLIAQPAPSQSPRGS